MTEHASDPAFAAALAALPGMGPATLVRMLGVHSPEECWKRIRTASMPPGHDGAEQRPLWSGPGSLSLRTPEVLKRWSQAAASFDPPTWWQPSVARGIRVTWYGQPDYPRSLSTDPQPPGVLFWRGDLDVLAAPSVAVVGTRKATPDGRRVAREMGRDLSSEGVCVVSGLALGIDGAAHEGAVLACRTRAGVGPAGVAASGVDVAYPRRHAGLWRDVTDLGVMLSENAPGRRPEAWRFPSRNRLIAGLVSLVVVVESHARGGSLITAEAAMDRGVEVRVVPGPVHSPASAGSNQLLYDGPGPVRDARDVLDAIGQFRDRPRPVGEGSSRSQPRLAETTPRPLRGTLGEVFEAVAWVARPVGSVVGACRLPPPEVLAALGRLEEMGLVEDSAGWWSRRGCPGPEVGGSRT